MQSDMLNTCSIWGNTKQSHSGPWLEAWRLCPGCLLTLHTENRLALQAYTLPFPVLDFNNLVNHLYTLITIDASGLMDDRTEVRHQKLQSVGLKGPARFLCFRPAISLFQCFCFQHDQITVYHWLWKLVTFCNNDTSFPNYLSCSFFEANV